MRNFQQNFHEPQISICEMHKLSIQKSCFNSQSDKTLRPLHNIPHGQTSIKYIHGHILHLFYKFIYLYKRVIIHFTKEKTDYT